MARNTSVQEDKDMASELLDMIDISFEVDARKVLELVRDYYQPEDVFESVQLEAWARDRGFILG